MARKKHLRKDEYTLLPNCFTAEAEISGNWREEFQQQGKLILELGCGKAELSLELARRYPHQLFVGIDLKPDRMWYPAQEALKESIHNIRFLYTHLLSMERFFDEDEVDEIWITFPDPYPKNRQAKHRMINPSFLSLYQKVLKTGGSIHFKTDNLELFHYSLETFVHQGNIQFELLSFDLHEAAHIPEDAKINTTYEKAFLDMGKKINYTKFQFIGK